MQIKILAIGNSFSQDAVRYLKDLAQSSGAEIQVVNLYIGGCSLQRHAQNIAEDAPAYVYELNGCATSRMVSIREALTEDTWDIVTIQQASHDSGLPETYDPWGTRLLECIRKYAPQAVCYFHMTWAYELGSDHHGFTHYQKSQEVMYQSILSAVQKFTTAHGLPVIPSGTVIQALRQLPEFNYAHGGLSLCRDGFHMSLDYGRFALAAVWVETLLKKSVLNASFAPENTDSALLTKILQTVHQCCTPKG